jgi:hypothetical protein
MELKKAQRQKVKLKMNVSAPTGFGKTTGALLIAYGITGDWDKIAVIDSENRSASLFENHRLTLPSANGFVIGAFQTIQMEPPYTVDSFCKAVDICVNAGIEVIIADSIYHYWHGKGGVLDYVGSLGGKFQDWAKGSPMWQRLLDKVLQTDAHFISTTRKKQAYEIVEANGKKTVEKKGMEDQVRDGYEYEMTIALEIISDKHLAKASKDRSGLFTGQPEFIITPETGKRIKQWCESGADPIRLPALSDTAYQQALARISSGESALYGKLKGAYLLTEDQKSEIEIAIANLPK